MQAATARITNNHLLEAIGWRFFTNRALPANVQLAPGVTLTSTPFDALGNAVEKTTTGYVDVLLLDAQSFPSSSWRRSPRRSTRSSAKTSCSPPTARTLVSATRGMSPIRS
jgi:hypothetical protein